MSSLSSAWKSVSEIICGGANSNTLLKYSCLQIFKQKRDCSQSLCLSVSANFSVVFWQVELKEQYTTSNHEFSFKMSAWPCHGIDCGENNVQVWQTVQVLYFGAREHLFIYLFIYLLFFILLLNYVAANVFGIWNLRNTGKSVTNWVTPMLSYTLH